MSRSDAFALKNSGLNEFLFAEVGNEVNGSPLTLLSVLARLGQDPWTEAARLARLPKAALIDCLANNISQMPLCPQALTDARTTATRLTLLLPSQAPLFSSDDRMPGRKPFVPRWALIVIFVAALTIGIAFELLPSTTQTSPITRLVDPGINHPPAAGK